MSFESFYGGRMGASFVIVKRFDGIDIPQTEGNETYKAKIYAYKSINKKPYLLIENGNLIERTTENFANYDWTRVELNGQEVETTEGKRTMPIALAEGMVQCFAQGGNSTNEVNYGEYVIIDTLVGLNKRNDPDNGKVFRRGMNYIDGDLKGAEYIGQIIGPQGDTPDIALDTIKTIKESAVWEEDQEGAYEYTAAADGGLVPGKTATGEFNDKIHYAWVNLKDSGGNIDKALIGFEFPYLVIDWSAEKRKPYYIQGDVIPSGKAIGDLLADNFEFVERLDDNTHPYYQSWKIHLPHGIKGDSQNDLEVYPERAHKGAKMYNTSSLTGDYTIATGDEIVNLNAYNEREKQQKAPYDLPYILLSNGKYISTQDGWKLKVRYKEYIYDEKENPEPNFIEIGEYNMIEKITLSPEGVLTAYYTYKDTEDLEEQLRWIYYNGDNESEGIYVEDDGTVVVVFNTMTTDPSTGDRVHETEIHEKAIPWISFISLGNDGKIRVTYNNDKITQRTGIDAQGRAYYENDIPWFTSVSLSNSGDLKFVYNNNSDKITMKTGVEDGKAVYVNDIPWLTSVNLANNGDLKFTYNNNSNKITMKTGVEDGKAIYKDDIPWFTSVTLDDDTGNLKFVYNNNSDKIAMKTGVESGKAIYEDDVPWIRSIDLDKTGNFEVIYNNNSDKIKLKTGSKVVDGETRAYYQSKLPYPSDIKINTTNSSGEEGSGDQKVAIQYNGEGEYDEIGEPLNYILDTYAVSPKDTTSGLGGHLLVYYSDPERRRMSPIENLSFYSARLGKEVTGWTDIGEVSGEIKFPLSIGVYSNFEEVVNAGGGSGNNPPEVIMKDIYGNPDYRYAGWGAKYFNSEAGLDYIALYDYTENEWTTGLPYDRGIDRAYKVINYGPNPTDLLPDGFRIDSQNRVIANENLPHGVVYQLSKKQSDDDYDSRPIGSEVRYIGAQRNSNNYNLEEQLMLGTDNIITEKEEIITQDNKLQTVERIEYRAPAENNDYYVFEKAIVTERPVIFNNNKLTININPNINSKTEVLSYHTNDDDVFISKKVLTYNNDNVIESITHVNN